MLMALPSVSEWSGMGRGELCAGHNARAVDRKRVGELHLRDRTGERAAQSSSQPPVTDGLADHSGAANEAGCKRPLYLSSSPPIWSLSECPGWPLLLPLHSQRRSRPLAMGLPRRASDRWLSLPQRIQRSRPDHTSSAAASHTHTDAGVFNRPPACRVAAREIVRVIARAHPTHCSSRMQRR